MSHILVFDVGSSALKAVLFSENGEIIARAEAAYGASSREHRQSPEEWWNAAVAAMRDLPAKDITAIALTGTMENLIPVTGDGQPLGDAMLYSDPCGAPLLAELSERLDAVDAARLCGNAPEPLMTAFKLAWLRRHEPHRFDEAACFLPGSKDFLALRLTGKAATDPACAATTGLMDIASRTWSAPLLAIFGIAPGRLPPIRPAGEIVGRLTAEAAAALGLPPGIPIINGCGDGAATTVGGGADRLSDVSLYLGTSGWVARVAGDTVLATPARSYRLPHPLGGGIIEIAPILSAGAAAAWARKALRLELDEAEALAAAADAAPADAIFLPYLQGERSPFLDLEVRGAFLGLSPDHGPGQLYLAVLEGVALAIAANVEAMGGTDGQISLAGGGALSPLWSQIMADILGAAILAPIDPAAVTAYGAFRIAHRALGLPPIASALSMVAQPRPARAQRTARLRRRFGQATALVRQFR